MRHGTYSIVARDPKTGELGVAVQSHWFSVGSMVPWAQAGVGAVATQSIVEVSYGPQAMELLADGLSVDAALDRLVAADAAATVRQVAIVDATGDVGVHTGAGCVPHAGHALGDGFACQGNMMASPTVWGAMKAAFVQASELPLAERMLAALDAGEAAGGDVRGRQSAALLVLPATPEAAWRRSIDLRVEDHPEPLEELRRLLVLARAYQLAGEGDDLIAQGRHAEAGERYADAARLAPGNDELLFWAGLAAADRGADDDALRLLREAIAISPRWTDLLARLPDHIAPSAARMGAAL